MKKLTSDEKDALIEIANIGMSKAAKQLSVLLNSPIKINIPKIQLLDINQGTKQTLIKKNEIYSCVSQLISSDITGNAALIFQRIHSNLITKAVLGKIPEFTQKEMTACEHEAMVEIANVIISSCISVIVNMLGLSVRLHLPIYQEATSLPLVKNLFQSITEYSEDYIVMSTTLDAFEDKIHGSLFIIISEKSTNVFFKRIRKLIKDGYVKNE